MTFRLIAVVLFLVSGACAQFENGSPDMARRVRIRVAFRDYAACDSSTRLVLTGNTGFTLAESSVNGECIAEFRDVPSGRYQVSVKGEDATNADEGDVEVSPVISQNLEVHAKHTQGSDPVNSLGTGSFVSVAELKMPSGAAKEFEKAGRLIEKRDWQKASNRLQKGLAAYSAYAGGYNNLGAVYLHLGNIPQAREALEKAIVLDDRLVPAYVNLARLSFIEKDYPAAETLLDKAIGLARPANSEELILLAYAQITDKHLKEAIQTSVQGHTMQLKQHSFLHLVAANAFEQQGKIADSIQELRMYVSEEPNGPQAGKVTSAIATLQAQIAER